MASSTKNLTNIDEDPFGELREYGFRNLADTPYVVLDYLVPVFSAIKIFLYISSIASNLFLIYLINFRFTKLKTKINKYITHYCITNAAFFGYVILQLFIKKWGYNDFVFCAVFEMDDACLFLSFVMINLLAVDWFITSFKPELIPKYENVGKYLVLVLYLTGVLKFFITSSTCFFPQLLLIRYNLLNFLYFLILLLNISLRVVKCCRNVPNEPNKNASTLFIANFVIFSWMPSFIHHYLLYFFINHETFSLVLFYTKIITEIFAYSGSLSLVFILRRFNPDIKKSIHAFFEGTNLADDRFNLNEN